MLLCSLAHASPRVALSGVPVCTGAHSRGGGVRVPAVFCPPAGLVLPRLGPSAPPGVGPYSSACVCVSACARREMQGHGGTQRHRAQAHPRCAHVRV